MYIREPLENPVSEKSAYYRRVGTKTVGERVGEASFYASTFTLSPCLSLAGWRPKRFLHPRNRRAISDGVCARVYNQQTFTLSHSPIPFSWPFFALRFRSLFSLSLYANVYRFLFYRTCALCVAKCDAPAVQQLPIELFQLLTPSG